MHIVRRFLVVTLVPALIVSIFAVGAVAANGSSGKVELCHWASHKFVKITVSLNAEPSHLRHGDVEVDEYGDCSSDNSADSGDDDGNESDQGSEHDSGNHGSGHDSNAGADAEDD